MPDAPVVDPGNSILRYGVMHGDEIALSLSLSFAGTARTAREELRPRRPSLRSAAQRT